MGVHDFGCMLMNPEGEQCLPHPDSKNNDVDPNRTIGEILDPDNEYDFSTNIEEFNEIAESITDDMSSGSIEAYLEVFIFSESKPENRKSFEKMIKKKLYKRRFFYRVDYSWDHWDFSGRKNKLTFGYRFYEDDGGMGPIWKLKIYPEEEPFHPKVYEWLKQGDVWIRNWSDIAKEVIDRKSWDPLVNDESIIVIANNLGLKYNSKTTISELFNIVRKTIRQKMFI